MSKPKGYPKDAWKGPDGRMRDSFGRIVDEWGNAYYDGPILWNPPKADIPADAREALPKLWDQAKEIWLSTWTAFNDVAFSIAGDPITRVTHKVMGDWVRNVELLLRRIVIIAALTLDLPPPKLRPADAATRLSTPRTRKPGEVVLDNCETWRTSFRLFPSCGPSRWRQAPRRIAHRAATARRIPTARGYALRIEALRRVILHRDAYALRVAHRLQRLAIANAKANEPRELAIAAWSFHPTERTRGRYVIEEAMRLAQPLACRVADGWNKRYVEPG